ncbi:hypothetical protein B0T26DRAFT_443675 [Lasiosphaeria miniovina]|uniref:Uncharacterized protein n=1 Tax=Lasiosphaeria miniovina TaxID=1954250 RepID=A0AA40DNB0_9PEZI|nr:uncharacterized protein B0T26DRAFT_443675 [Lasiosphaeria miniovina]KAK0706128.1 hypothetical protein B0T26DRAFT_443675 [Lasiosphaeria miniovina]
MPAHDSIGTFLHKSPDALAKWSCRAKAVATEQRLNFQPPFCPTKDSHSTTQDKLESLTPFVSRWTQDGRRCRYHLEVENLGGVQILPFLIESSPTVGFQIEARTAIEDGDRSDRQATAKDTEKTAQCASWLPELTGGTTQTRMVREKKTVDRANRGEAGRVRGTWLLGSSAR